MKVLVESIGAVLALGTLNQSRAMLASHPVPARFVFDRAPQRVYWEVTRACSLACRHCRAEASTRADPGELDTADGEALLDRIAAFGEPKPHVILTGGDPLERGDLFQLIAHARTRGLRVSVSPSATPRLTASVIAQLGAAGVEAISLSIDRAQAAEHDALRGADGCFARTIAAARAAAESRLAVQLNTLVSAETMPDLPAVYQLALELAVARWSLFFLVTVGRGNALQPIDSTEAQRVLEWAADLPREPVVTTTEAPHFRRIALQRRSLPISQSMRTGYGIRDGNGVAFVSHTGEVSPSGFLPISAGNVRSEDFVKLYRSSPLFVALRGADAFEGRCGACGYRAICGGSRARAWSATHRLLGEDPLCTYDPRADAPGATTPS
jgi:MoaA/NifB/PqqE/SkfB family radical SAM enzyme